MITHEDLEGLTEEQIKKVESMLPHDDEYLTTFHKEWNEARVRENIRIMKGPPITAEYMRAQTRRMDALVKEMEEQERKKKLEKKRNKIYKV